MNMNSMCKYAAIGVAVAGLAYLISENRRLRRDLCMSGRHLEEEGEDQVVAEGSASQHNVGIQQQQRLPALVEVDEEDDGDKLGYLRKPRELTDHEVRQIDDKTEVLAFLNEAAGNVTESQKREMDQMAAQLQQVKDEQRAKRFADEPARPAPADA